MICSQFSLIDKWNETVVLRRWESTTGQFVRALRYSLWRRANARNVSFLTLNDINLVDDTKLLSLNWSLFRDHFVVVIFLLLVVVVLLQSTLYYPESLGRDEIVRIIEYRKINEEQKLIKLRKRLLIVLTP